jgi:hypothetical protein
MEHSGEKRIFAAHLLVHVVHLIVGQVGVLRGGEVVEAVRQAAHAQAARTQKVCEGV